MNDNLLSLPILPLIKSSPALTAALGQDVTKVNKYLRLHARRLQRDVDQLTLLDLCDERGELLPGLLAVINERQRKKGCSDKSFASYSGQIISRIKGIVRDVAQFRENEEFRAETPDGTDVPTEGNADAPLDLLAIVPEFLRPILVYLPRTCGHRAGPEMRLASPLSSCGLLQLRALLNTCAKFDVKSLQDLFVSHWPHLQQGWRAVCEPSDISSGYNYFMRLSLMAGFPPEKRRKGLKLEELPPRLRAQVETYREKALSGAAEDQALQELAARKRYKLTAQEQSTIVKNCETLGWLLARIPYLEDIEITDLIRTEGRTVLEDGEQATRYYNPYMEAIREEERAKTTPFKRKGFDSATFIQVISSIKVVAAYNGIFRYHEKFREAYKTNPDVGTRERKKSLKKEVFDLPWVDQNLARLRPRFEEIVKYKSFRDDLESLELVLCYVVVMILRYTGVRQQCLRDCRISEQVNFEKNGWISFRWRTKNKKVLTTTIKPTQANSFAPLCNALWLYYKNVYPHLVQAAREHDSDLGGQLFPRVTAQGEVRLFSEGRLGRTEFGRMFARLTQRHFDFEGIEPSMRGSFNPHHLRGLGADWVDTVLGMGEHKAAAFQANDVETTRRSYLDRRRIDLTPLYDEMDRRAAEMSRGDRPEADVVPDEQLRRVYETQIAALQDQVASAIRQLGEERAAHAAERTSLLGEITSLRRQVERMNELVEKFTDKKAA